ncbi:MAG: hypothetical protein WEF86_13915 [Gemmatimonadota bacterium]
MRDKDSADDVSTRNERATRNKGLQQEQQRLEDPDGRSPHSAAQQDAPVPERPITILEEADEDIAHLENPPQTDGPREKNNDAV